MKKKILIFALLICSLFIFAACGGSSSSSNETTQNSEGSTQSDSASNSSQSDTSNQNSTTSTASIIGDWSYEGTIDNKNYDINLELEKDNSFSLEVDEESTEDTIDSEATGTYTSTDNSITLSIITVQDQNSYFGGEVVQNGQVTLDYTLNDTGNQMTLTNAKNSITILPGELVLTKDD